MPSGPVEVQHGRVSDEFGLQRFVDAQDAGGTYVAALRELRHGYKRGHWMWFVFPQIAGLGRSETAQRYAISGLPEAVAYLAHPTSRCSATCSTSTSRAHQTREPSRGCDGRVRRTEG